MRYKCVLLMILNLCMLVSTVRSELLIVKKGKNGFVPLDASDIVKSGKIITDIILKYQWPMCISSQLSQEEQDALLTSQKPYAQELFIQNKIRESFDEYGVVFIPTALYELFCIVHLFKTINEKNPFQDAVNKFIRADNERDFEPNKWATELTEILNKKESPADIRKQIDAIYKNANDLFFRGDGIESAYLYINNAIAASLFNQYPELTKSKDPLALSSAIKDTTSTWAAFLIEELWAMYDPDFPDELLHPLIEEIGIDYSKLSINNLAAHLQHESMNNILAKVITLEYEARERNKALLLRGTSFEEEFQIGITEEKILAGTTLPSGILESPYSISFGNSLFAGILLDPYACAYHYLVEFAGSSRRPSVGYALFIDKKAYFEHQVHNLFFIPPLASITSLSQRGEYFHPRAKAAILLKSEGRKEPLLGLLDKIIDPTGVILITRNPLHHAELFSKFLADNGRIIQSGDISNLTEEERRFVQEVIQAQAEAAKFYLLKRIIIPIQRKLKERRKQ